MSCLDVMYHQSYGAHYLPAAAYKATYYNHHHHHQQQQQQRKLSAYSKMQECMEQQDGQAAGRGMLPRDQGLRHGGRRSTASDPKDGPQPAEAEYLSSRCVLFTYFQGDVGDVIDEHFSRALSQSGAFGGESKALRVTQQSPSAIWKDGASLSEGHSSSAWNSTTYPSQTSPCLPSVSVHPDFSTSPASFNPPDGALWAGHVLSQASLPPPTSLPESWPYSLNAQSAGGYPSVHDVYHPHTHIHPRHHHHHHPHPMLHSYTTHSPALDPRFNPLLLPGVRSQSQSNAGSSPLSDGGVKSEMDPSSVSPVSATSVAWTPSGLHGSLEAYDTALDQTKPRTPVWF